MTTRRYTEADVLEFEKSDHYLTLQVHLQDKFGDNGMISVLICKNAGDCREIDTWLMSCRMIKRRVEDAVCDELVAIARSSGIEKLRGYYRPTGRNKLIKNHYQQLGFVMISSDDSEDIWGARNQALSIKYPPIAIQIQ